ncbi:hypothetical protein Golomagni_05384, partial [Golovinomyces magnicellulatus]
MAQDLVLITGATGMIGFRTLVGLLKDGYTVRAAVRTQESFDRITKLPSLQPYLNQLSSVIVPDITVSEAYDEAVKGVKFVVHVASPIPGGGELADPEVTLIKPAIRGTLSILESAHKEPSIKRVVITASVASIASGPKSVTEELITGTYNLHPRNVLAVLIMLESTRDVNTNRPFANDMAAYSASKALAYQASNDFIKEKQPTFDVINIMPVYVVGRDETVTEPSNIGKGTNGIAVGPLFGHPLTSSVRGLSVHVDDVADMHVRALDLSIPGGQDFLATGADSESINWADAIDLVKRR